jgi:hypothetical protein
MDGERAVSDRQVNSPVSKLRPGNHKQASGCGDSLDQVRLFAIALGSYGEGVEDAGA